MTSRPILKLEKVSKSFAIDQQVIHVLQDIDLEIGEGSTAAIVGPSGSGKTTLLGLCAGLDACSSGRIWLNNIELNTLSEDQLAQVRNEQVGFVFQNFQLLPTLTALENVLVPMELRGLRGQEKRARELLAQVGLAERAHHYPSQLSGGEQQRVSLARAFANKPRILFADEPTGNLDAETGQVVEALLFELNEQWGTTLVLVTHDLELAGRTQRIIPIKGGRIV